MPNVQKEGRTEIYGFAFSLLGLKVPIFKNHILSITRAMRITRNVVYSLRQKVHTM